MCRGETAHQSIAGLWQKTKHSSSSYILRCSQERGQGDLAFLPLRKHSACRPTKMTPAKDCFGSNAFSAGHGPWNSRCRWYQISGRKKNGMSGMRGMTEMRAWDRGLCTHSRNADLARHVSDPARVERVDVERKRVLRRHASIPAMQRR